MNRTTSTALVLVLILIDAPSPARADDWPARLAREGTCGVCERRGSAHGAEPFAAWRAHEERAYGFCSKSCAEAFDQMPGGYVPAVLPRPAPDFAWTSTEGRSIARGGDEVLLVDFWATWCKPCLAVMPELERLAREHAADGVRVVGVSIDEKRSDLDAFLRRRPVGYDIVHDGGDVAASEPATDPAWWRFQVPAIPAAFLLDRDGHIVAQWSGPIDFEELGALLQALTKTAPQD